jgi:hypothetical protein
MKTILEDFRGHQEATPRGRAREAARWGWLAPSSGPRLSASEMFLYRLPRLHLCRPSSRSNPRAHIGPSRLYKETLAPPKASSHLRSSHLEPKTLISSEVL